MKRLLRHVSLLGGIVMHPRATFARIIFDREGSLLELLPWVLIVGMAIEPVRAGQALLLVRTSFVDGIMMLLSVVSSRMAPVMTGVLIAAVTLWGAETMRRPKADRLGFDAALDAAAFAIVPYLVLASIGRAFAMYGLDAWWLPHHTVRGNMFDRTLEIAAGYGWSIALFVLASVIFLKHRRT